MSWCAYFPGWGRGGRGAEGRDPTPCSTQGPPPSPLRWRHVCGPPNLRNHNFIPEYAGVRTPAPTQWLELQPEVAIRVDPTAGAQVSWFPGPSEPGTCTMRSSFLQD